MKQVCWNCEHLYDRSFKVMVYLNVTEVQMVRWRVFDPLPRPRHGQAKPYGGPKPRRPVPRIRRRLGAIGFATRKATEDGS